VQWLPETLSSPPRYRWTAKVPGEGIGGVAAANGVVVIGCRDASDTRDVFCCLDLQTGHTRWQSSYVARASLDYGNSPRATPLIGADRVWTFGATGRVHCFDIRDGSVIWDKDVAREFKTPMLTWGLTGSPLLVDDKLVVQPGGTDAGLVALDPSTGDVIWKSAGGLPGHSSPVFATIHGVNQIIGYDQVSLGGWDARDGRRLWGVIPPVRGDFNVPTPLVMGELVFVTTENNGSRLYEFDVHGRAEPVPKATFADLAPDTSSPVAMNGRIYGASSGLVCLDSARGLKQLWSIDDPAFYNSLSVIACPHSKRLLAMTHQAELVLIEDEGLTGKVRSRVSLDQAGVETLSHPAVVKDLLLVRVGTEIRALELCSLGSGF
jgi:outer membrane protein assembly factor BamB